MKWVKCDIQWGPDATNDRIIFNLDQPGLNSPYYTRSISGLEPPENAVSIVDQVIEGGIFQGQRPTQREIVMIVGFIPDYTVVDPIGTLRKSLYRMMTPRNSAPVTFRLTDATATNWVRTYGYVKRIEANIFSKDPEVQITFACTASFFEHGSYTHPTPSVFSGISPITVTTEGDAPTGFLATFQLTAAMASFHITNALFTKQIRFIYAFLSGDQIQIDTRAGTRLATVNRSSVITNLLPYMQSDSVWLQLEGITTQLALSTTSFTCNQMTFVSRHWGF